MARAGTILLDPYDGVALRTYYESLRAQLTSDRSSNDAKWKQLEAIFAPGTARWDYTDAQNGARKDLDLLNETGLLALRVAKAGMFTGMSSQTRPWFKVAADRKDLNDKPSVKRWCQDAAEVVRGVFLKSNFYETLLEAYGEEALYGRTAFTMVEDPATVIRCQPWPIGSYYLGVDDALRVDLGVRVLTMTARQLVERFGRDVVSTTAQLLYDSTSGGQKETRLPVVHVIHRGNYYRAGGPKPVMPWVSIYYEMASFNEKAGILSRSGFLECPLIAGRWRVVGENVYGKSAAEDCLGSNMSLQAWEARLAQAAEKQIDPTLVAGTDVDPTKLTTLPGDIIWADTKDVSNVLKPAYQFEFRLEGGLNMLQRIESRIDDAMYRKVFQMFSDSDRREITAAEINARAAEKMQLLGPVVERNIGEVLAPSVVRTLSICERRGMLPPLPDELKGQRFKLEFTSILAQAAKMAGLNNLTQFMGILGNEVAVDQGILDNVDMDAFARKVADLADVPTEILRTPEQIAQIRADRDRQQQQAQAAENAQKLAAAAQNLSNAPVGTGSMLDKTLPALAGGAES